MSKILLGLIAGLVFGALDVALMLPMCSQITRRLYLAHSPVDSPSGSSLVACSCLPQPGWVVGLLFGLLISLPDAIITHKQVPILVLGGIRGLVMGGLIYGWRVHM